MKCSCNAGTYVDDEDSYITLKNDIRIAKKDIKCIECNDIIKKNDKYEFFQGSLPNHFNKNKRTIDTYTTCLDCLSIRDTFFYDGWFYEGMYEALESFLDDCYYQIPESCLSKLTKKSREYICGLIEKNWGR